MHHPLLNSLRSKIVALAAILFMLLLHGGFLVFYIHADVLAAIIESLVSVGVFVALAYFVWYTVGFVHVWQAEVLLMIGVISLWVTSGLVGFYMGQQISSAIPYNFLLTLPLRVLIGSLCWMIVAMGYKIQRLTTWKKERITAEKIQALQPEELTDRIAVKDGTRIHVIPLKDLIYIQANGDYILLVSSTGQYLKEQTMKSMESQLPALQFIRVHRSFIVNVSYIQKVELHGKETYRVSLKNGDAIKASQAGYKLLREQLAL